MRKIIDEFTDLPVSRERKRQLRNHKRGLCKCGSPQYGLARKCLKCLQYCRRMANERDGTSQWEPGKRGRPPVEAEGRG